MARRPTKKTPAKRASAKKPAVKRTAAKKPAKKAPARKKPVAKRKTKAAKALEEAQRRRLRENHFKLASNTLLYGIESAGAEDKPLPRVETGPLPRVETGPLPPVKPTPTPEPAREIERPKPSVTARPETSPYMLPLLVAFVGAIVLLLVYIYFAV